MNWWGILLFIVYALVLLNYLNLISIIYSEKIQKKWPVLVGALVPAAIMLLCPDMDNYGKVTMAYIGSLIAFFLMISGNIVERIKKVLEMFFMSECLEGLASIIAEVAGFNTRIGEIIDIAYAESLTTHIAVALVLGTLYFLKQRNKVKWKMLWDGLSRKSYYWIIIMVVSMLISVGCLGVANDYVDNKKFDIITTGICGIAYVSIGILSIFIVYIKQMNERMEQILQQEIFARNMQAYYYEELLKKEEDTRRYRHDMINHLICINGLAKEQKNTELMNYIDNMQDQINHIQKSTYAVGNQILNIVTNYYLSMVHSGVNIKISGNADDRLRIDDSVLCTVYANLLNNAVEELKKVQKGYLCIEFLQGDEYFQIKIVNSLSIDSQNKENILITDKADKKAHGLGLKNVQRAVADNNGKLDIKYDKEKFEVIAILKNL